MAKRAPSMTPEERERVRREREAATRSIRIAEEQAATARAQAYLRERGVMVAGEGVGARLARLDAYRRALVQASAPAYRPTPRQVQARPCPGIDVEIEF